MRREFIATEKPLILPDVNEEGNTVLKQWRLDNDITYKQAASRIGVSVATYFRYESGNMLYIHKCNEIVQMTRGKVRYRDLVGGFKPEYS